ncbi:MAG: UbiA family prenyltransferase, partial [Balneolaceae bacterium]
WWDKDQGPIGGLKNPPEMKSWMRDVSLLMQFGGLVWAAATGWVFSLVYAISMFFFWLYSTPLARWKGSPVLSLNAIGISTGTNSVILGVLAGGGTFTFEILIAAAGCGFVLLSLYPVSQIYQLKEDLERGDHTFAGHFGIKGVQQFFRGAFISGIGLIAFSMFAEMQYISIGFAVMGTIAWIFLCFRIYRLRGREDEYEEVMKIKLVTSILFVLFLIGIHSARYLNYGIV